MNETGHRTEPAEHEAPGDEQGEHPAPGDTVGHADVGDGSANGADGSAWRRWRWLLPWVLVILAVAVAAASTWQWQQLAAVERAREAVTSSAGTFMLTLTTWDATEGMGAVRDELRDAGTERFAGEVDELFGTTEDLVELRDIGARSEGDVRRLHVQEIEDDQAVAFVVLSQRVVTDVTEGEEVSLRYAEVDLVHRDAEWLVDEVELLADVGQQEAEPVTPGTGDEEAS